MNMVRFGKELSMLRLEPPPGIEVWLKEIETEEETEKEKREDMKQGPMVQTNNYNHYHHDLQETAARNRTITTNVLVADVMGPEDSPFEEGKFRLEVTIPNRYPFEPPFVQFKTRIYHPNIDKSGRICLDTLKSPPMGSWNPSINISTLLTTIRLLMAYPNSDDGLVPEITQLYQQNQALYEQKAREYTLMYASASATRTRITAVAEIRTAPNKSGNDIARPLSQNNDSHENENDDNETSQKVTIGGKKRKREEIESHEDNSKTN